MRTALIALSQTSDRSPSPNQTTPGRRSAPHWQRGGSTGKGTRSSSALKSHTMHRNLPDAAMQLQDISTTSLLMEAVHILSYDRVRRNRIMSWIWLRFRDQAAAPVIPLPDQLRVSLERFLRREIFGPEILPKTAGPPKCRHSAFGRNPRAGQHRYRLRRPEPLAYVFHWIYWNTGFTSSPDLIAFSTGNATGSPSFSPSTI